MTTETITRCDYCVDERPEVRRLCERPWLRLEGDDFGERDFCSIECLRLWATREGARR